MPKAKINNIKVEEDIAEVHQDIPQKSEKEKLLELYQVLKDLGINSIGDLENKIAKAE